MASGSDVSGLIPEEQYTLGSGPVPLPHLIDATRAESEFAWRRDPLPDRLRQHMAEARVG